MKINIGIKNVNMDLFALSVILVDLLQYLKSNI